MNITLECLFITISFVCNLILTDKKRLIYLATPNSPVLSHKTLAYKVLTEVCHLGLLLPLVLRGTTVTRGGGGGEGGGERRWCAGGIGASSPWSVAALVGGKLTTDLPDLLLFLSPEVTLPTWVMVMVLGWHLEASGVVPCLLRERCLRPVVPVPTVGGDVVSTPPLWVPPEETTAVISLGFWPTNSWLYVVSLRASAMAFSRAFLPLTLKQRKPAALESTKHEKYYSVCRILLYKAQS